MIVFTIKCERRAKPDPSKFLRSHFKPCGSMKNQKPTPIFPKVNIKESKAVQVSINKALGKFSKKLKSFATCGIDKPLTMHVARHSFSNVLGDRISIQIPQKLYRHTKENHFTCRESINACPGNEVKETFCKWNYVKKKEMSIEDILLISV